MLLWLGAALPATAASMWIGPNFVDTSHSVLFDSRGVERVPSDHPMHAHIPFGWVPHRVRAQVVETYKGALQPGAPIEVLVYLTWPLDDGLETLRGRFLLSFCKAANGTYYTSRDFLLTAATDANIAGFRAVRDQGSDYEGSGDCSGNYPDLDPDRHDAAAEQPGD